MTEPTTPRPGKTDAPRESMIDRKQTGCCEEAQADGVGCTSPRSNCETCGKSVVDFSRHVCDCKHED